MTVVYGHAPIFEHTGSEQQRALTVAALDLCDFPFDRLAPSLAREGRASIRVEWADLSRYRAGGHAHIRDGDAIAYPIEREVETRARVLGLFYLPPNTKIVLDTTLTAHPALAHEVFLAEAAHAVDYHYMTADHRRAVVDALHVEDLPAGADVSDTARFRLDGHVCGWFADGIPYQWWCGEAMMEAFTEAFAPAVPVTVSLAHPVTAAIAAQVRRILLDDAQAVYQGPASSRVYHDTHKGIAPGRVFASAQDAQAAGLRACKVCRPR